MVGRWDRMYVMAGASPDYEPTPEKSIAAIAGCSNSSPQEIAYDYLTEGLDRFLFFPIVNYSDGDHATVREMLTDPATLLGLSDGGAHCGAIVDASVLIFMLTHWGRDAAAVPVSAAGIGENRPARRRFSALLIAPPRKVGADVNLIDFDQLRPSAEVVDDFAGGRRLVQRVDGYRATSSPARRSLKWRTGARPPGARLTLVTTIAHLRRGRRRVSTGFGRCR
jgi:N-acyl-D-aspartate/D-glutamate deacylase